MTIVAIHNNRELRKIIYLSISKRCIDWKIVFLDKTIRTKKIILSIQADVAS